MSAQGAINVQNKVSDLQSKLYHAAKQSLDRRFGALYDKIYREDGFLHDQLRIFLKRKYSDQTRGYKRIQGNLFVRLGLNQFV